MDLKDRLLSRIKKVGECWYYSRACNTDGYGVISHLGKMMLTHRVSFELFHGFIEDNLVVRHMCHQRKCLNPSHLILGSHADNMRDLRLKNFNRKRKATLT